MVPDEPQSILIIGRGWVFHPKQIVLLDFLAKSRCLSGQQPMMHIMQQLQIRSKAISNRLEDARHVPQIFLCIPNLLIRQLAIFGDEMFGISALAGRVTAFGHARNAALKPNGFVSLVHIMRDRIEQGIQSWSGRMRVKQCAVPALAAKQLVKRKAGNFPFDIPQSQINRTIGRHRDRASAEIGAAIEILPDILAVARVHSDEARDEIFFQILCRQRFTSVQRGIANAVYSGIRHDF